jgi:hypothetical protein
LITGISAPRSNPQQGGEKACLMIEFAKMISVLLGAIILGNWFFTEFKKNLPWYAAYLTTPGLLVLAALALPVIYWLVRG